MFSTTSNGAQTWQTPYSIYALTRPNGCFVPPVSIGRTADDITLEEIVAFENVSFAGISDLNREIVQIMLGIDPDQ